MHSARPSVRLKWAPILRSRTQGTGKTTVLKILADQTGRDNVSMPSEQAIAEAKYNGFLAYKRLVGCNEFYGNQSWRTYNKVKTWITDEDVDVEMKFIEAHTIPATAHFILCSNEMVPILMDSRDRRFFVPTITEKKLPRAFWKDFYRWLNGVGPGIIRRWAEEFIQKHGDICNPEDAPMSGAKLNMIEQGRGDEMRLVRDIGEMIAAKGQGDNPVRVILTLDDFRAWLMDQKLLQGKKRLSGPLIQDTLRDVGLTILGQDDSGDRRKLIEGRKQITIVNFSSQRGEKWVDLVKRHRMTMEQVIAM